MPSPGAWTLEGLGIYANPTTGGPLIYVAGKDSDHSGLTIRRCTFDNRSDRLDSWIEVYEYTDLVISDSTFTKGSGTTGPKYYGVYIGGANGGAYLNEVSLTRVTIQDVGTASQRSGALRVCGANATVTDCIISGNTGKSAIAGGGISIDTNFNAPTNLTLAGTTTITGNTATSSQGCGAISVQTKPTIANTITIADTVTISSNDGPAAGGICHRQRYDGSMGTLTVTGGSVVTGNTSTSGFQCATVPESGSSTDVPGCVWT